MIKLIEERFELLTKLLELTNRQEAAIAAGHMNELMRVLSLKQRHLERLFEQNGRLREADATRELRDAHPTVARERFQQCDQMHRELLRRESQCQDELLSQRDEIASQLISHEGTRRAVSRYDQVGGGAKSAPGVSLDLSSDD